MTTATSVEALYKVRRGALDIVEVPELGYLAVPGTGPPDGPDFAAAVQALYGVSYAAHFLLKKERGAAPKVMPLEAQWWIEDPDQRDVLLSVARGEATMADTDRGSWCWQAMIMQPDPVDAAVVEKALVGVRAKRPGPALDRLAYVRVAEGRCAQVLHVGPYAQEGPSLVRLHQGLAAAGYRARGRHHEIYLGDPRRSAPEKLRTILRQPVEPG